MRNAVALLLASLVLPLLLWGPFVGVLCLAGAVLLYGLVAAVRWALRRWRDG